MMHPRWLALPLAMLTASAGCATAPAPRMLSADLHIGSLDDRTSFELDHSSDEPSASPEAGEELDDRDDSVDTPRKQRVRRLLYLTGLGAIGFGIVGTVGFGVGGRIVQAQMKNGYEDGDLTREREDQLSTTGTVMNALTITSAVVGLAGVIVAATVYGVDHARCGDLRPRRKQCPTERDAGSSVTTGAPAGGGTTGTPSRDAGAGSGASGATDEASGSGDASTGAPGGAAASSPGTGPAPIGPTPASEGPATAEPGPSPAGGKPSPGDTRASTSGAKPGQ